MDENQFWATCWKLLASVVIVLILTVGGCNAYTNTLIASTIASGADPLKVLCALDSSAHTGSTCAIVATKP